MEVKSLLALPDQLILEILSKWLNLRDFLSFDVALCEKSARKSYYDFLSYHTTVIRDSILDFMKKSSQYTPVTSLSDVVPGTIPRKIKRNTFMAINYYVKRNFLIEHISLDSWPFLDLEPLEWRNFLNQVQSISLNLSALQQSIEVDGWFAVLSEFRSFSSVKNLNFKFTSTNRDNFLDIPLLEILDAGEYLWKRPLESLTFEGGEVEGEYSYREDQNNIILSSPLSPKFGISLLEKLQVLKFDGRYITFPKNSTYLSLINSLASSQQSQLNTLIFDMNNVYDDDDVMRRAVLFLTQNIEMLLSKPEDERMGFQKLQTLEGIDAFAYPVLFLAPNLKNLRLYGGDTLFMGLAKHQPRLPHDITIPYHEVDEDDNLDEDNGDDEFYGDEDIAAEDRLRSATLGVPLRMPKLPLLESLFLSVDSREDMVRHKSVPIILGPFFKSLDCLSVLKTWIFRVSVPCNVVRCDIVDYFQSVIDDRAYGILPADACMQLRKVEFPDFLYLRYSRDPENSDSLPNQVIPRDSTIGSVSLAPEEDFSFCKMITQLAPCLETLDFHPERDRDNILYHRRRFRVTSVLPLASKLKSLHVDEVFRIMVPRHAIVNELSLLSRFSKLLHLTMRDSGIFFCDEELIPVLRALPQLLTLVLSVDDYIHASIESFIEMHQNRHYVSERELNTETDKHFLGNPWDEVKYSVHPTGNITTKTLDTIAKHNRNLRVLLLDIPCHPALTETDTGASATETLDAPDTLETKFIVKEEVLKDMEKNSETYSAAERSELLIPSLFNLWISMDRIKSRRQFYVRVEDRHNGPNLWLKSSEPGGHADLASIRSRRWEFRRDIRTGLLRKLEEWKTTVATDKDKYRAMTLGVMKSPLYLYRYEDRSGMDFLLEGGNNRSYQDGEDGEQYYLVEASMNEVEPEYSDDEMDSQMSFDESNEGFEEETDDGEENSEEDNENSEGDDEEDEQWSDIDFYEGDIPLNSTPLPDVD